ncbi:MAG: hypothetical protein R3B81_03245 [bacterium]
MSFRPLALGFGAFALATVAPRGVAAESATSPPVPPPSPPSIQDRLPGSTGTLVFLVVDVASGEIVRGIDEDAARNEPLPLGEMFRVAEAIVALETGAVDPETSVACDSTCWARGEHRDVTLVGALGWSCDSYFHDLEDRVPTRAIIERAVNWGWSDATESPPAARVEQVTALWRALARASLRVKPRTITEVLGGAGTAVKSPRGVARALGSPHRGARALAANAGDGAWVAGVTQIAEGRRWAFALFLRSGNANLAAARCAHLLDETERAFRTSSRERGGEAWAYPVE